MKNSKLNNKRCTRCDDLMVEFVDYCKHFTLLTQMKCLNCGEVVDEQILLNRNSATRHGRKDPVTGEWKGETKRYISSPGP